MKEASGTGLLKKYGKERFLRCVHDLTIQFISKNVVCSMSNHELRYEMTRISTLSTAPGRKRAKIYAYNVIFWICI